MLIVVFRTTRKTADYAPAMFDAAEYYSHKREKISKTKRDRQSKQRMDEK
jgi:hypothetical protein